MIIIFITTIVIVKFIIDQYGYNRDLKFFTIIMVITAI